MTSVLAYGTVSCLLTLSWNKTRSTKAGSLVGCRSSHGQPWPLFSLQQQRQQGVQEAKLHSRALIRRLCSYLSHQLQGNVYTQRNALPCEMGHLLLAPPAHPPWATSCRLMEAAPLKDGCRWKQVQLCCLPASPERSALCRCSINRTTKFLLLKK